MMNTLARSLRNSVRFFHVPTVAATASPTAATASSRTESIPQSVIDVARQFGTDPAVLWATLTYESKTLTAEELKWSLRPQSR